MIKMKEYPMSRKAEADLTDGSALHLMKISFHFSTVEKKKKKKKARINH